MAPDLHSENSAQSARVRAPIVPATAGSRSETAIANRPAGGSLRAGAMRWGICAIYIVLITWLSLAPTSFFKPALTLFPQADKLAHFLMYGFLVVVVRWAMTGSGMRWRPQGFWVPLTALLYGAVMEVAQLLLVPSDRSFEVGDMLANGAGALVFWGACNLWTVFRLRMASRKA